MNTQLYNSLVLAKEFLINVEKNEKDIQHRKDQILMAYTNPYVLPPEDHPKEFNFILFVILLSFCGAGIIYALYICLHNLKSKRKQAELDRLYNAPEEQRRRNAALAERERLKIELDKKIAEYKNYYSSNYWSKLGFLPDWARKIETIKDISNKIQYLNGVIYYVKRGAKSLDDAMEDYGRELRELDALEEQREHRRHMEEKQQQQLDALNTIAKNQRKTNDELERIRREYVDRW